MSEKKKSSQLAAATDAVHSQGLYEEVEIKRERENGEEEKKDLKERVNES